MRSLCSWGGRTSHRILEQGWDVLLPSSLSDHTNGSESVSIFSKCPTRGHNKPLCWFHLEQGKFCAAGWDCEAGANVKVWSLLCFCRWIHPCRQQRDVSGLHCIKVTRNICAQELLKTAPTPFCPSTPQDSPNKIWQFSSSNGIFF